MDEGRTIVLLFPGPDSRSIIGGGTLMADRDGAVIPGTGVERRVNMNFRGHREEQPPSTFAGDDPGRPAAGSQISRRALFRYGSGTVVVAGVGLAGLLELLQHRESISAGKMLQ